MEYTDIEINHKTRLISRVFLRAFNMTHLKAVPDEINTLRNVQNANVNKNMISDIQQMCKIHD